MLVMIMLCVGALLSSWTQVVTADSASYTVHASVPGPAPTVPATIDSPLSGVVFKNTPVTVTGTCPTGTYVEILRNNFSSGIALCSATGTYSLQIDLFNGVNLLLARDYSYTDQPGPDSGITTITYSPNNPVTGGGGTVSPTPYSPTNPNNVVPEPLVLKAHYTFVGYYIGQPATWDIHIEGGSPPYAMSVEWGDGTTQLYSIKESRDVSIQHVYKKTGGYHGSYPVKITATDADGDQTYLQLLVIISAKPKTVAAGSTIGGGGGIGQWLNEFNLGNTIGYIWSAYGLVFLMLLSFWLGERREYFVLQHRRHHRGHHA